MQLPARNALQRIIQRLLLQVLLQQLGRPVLQRHPHEYRHFYLGSVAGWCHHNYLHVSVAGDRLIGIKQSISLPTDIYSINIDSGDETQLSDVNSQVIGSL
ncbi:MAG: hypothetical protein ACO3MJ_05345, partial [Alphaproteobacteria bacterium]